LLENQAVMFLGYFTLLKKGGFWVQKRNERENFRGFFDKGSVSNFL